MPAELIYGQKPIMPIEQSILSWSTLPWYEGMRRLELLALRIDSSLDNQHSTIRKFSKRLFGPYIVKEVHDNATYALTKLDGFELRI
jgi:hypothetical protein